MVARLFEGCGVLPSGIITSHITSTPLVRAPSGNTATGLSTQSELWPSACWVEEPSKPQSGSCSNVGNEANSLIWVLPRKFGVGVYPSSQIYSSLYWVIELSLALIMLKWRTEAMAPHACTRPPSASYYQAFNVPNRCTAPCRGRAGSASETARPEGRERRSGCGIG